MIDEVYDDVAGFLSKAFRKRTKKIVAEDFEKHFSRHDEKIARKHKETLKELIGLKEAFAKKKIIGISREFEEGVQKTRKKAASLIADLMEHLENNNLFSSEKERRIAEQRARIYEQELSFMKRLFKGGRKFQEKRAAA